MAYIDFTKETVVILNGFEVATYVNTLDSKENGTAQYWGETDFADLIDAAVDSQCVYDIRDDRFKEWYVQPINRVVRYRPQEIASCALTLYYVPWTEQTIKNLEGIFDKGWLSIRTYTLYHTFDDEE